MKKLLFLGYGPQETKLHAEISALGWDVYHAESPITTLSTYDATLSYGYRHIIKSSVLDTATGPVINMHTSYLPYNRGSHPNFWAHFDGTAHGVTIHQVSPGLDTGPILLQRKVNFDQGETTFRATQNRLRQELEDLFLSRCEDLLEGNIVGTPQTGKGSYHSVGDLPTIFMGWDSEITEEIARIKKCTIQKMSKKN